MKINSQLQQKNNKSLILGSIVLLILSAIDARLTLRGLSYGIIEEVNPLMHWIIVQSPVAFMLFKLALPAILFLLVLWPKKRFSKVITYLLGITLVAYIAVIGLHIWWIVYPRID